MNSRRKQILQELNLLPAWRLKSDPSEKNRAFESPSTEIRNLIPPSDPAKDSQQCREIHQLDWDQLKLAVSLYILFFKPDPHSDSIWCR